MNRILRTLIVAAGLCTLPVIAQAADIFMLISTPSQPGDSTAKGHENWIRVASLDWNTQAQSSWTAGGGASVGKPSPGKLQLVLPNGFWSPLFLRLITQGKAVPKIVFDAVSSDGRPLYRLTVEGFFVTEYRLASLATTPLPQDHVSGVFKILKLEQFAQTADGRLITTVVDWNIVTGVSTPAVF